MPAAGPAAPARRRTALAVAAACLLSTVAASAVPAVASGGSAYDFANTRGTASSLAVTLSAGSSLATALVVEEDAHRRVVDWSYYEFGGSEGVEISTSSGRQGCSPCPTPLASQTVVVSRTLRPGHHIVLGTSGVSIATRLGKGVRTRRFGSYAVSEGDTQRIDTSAAEAADQTAVEAGRFSSAALPRLSGPSLVLASLPCEAAGIGTATLRGGSRAIDMNCTDTYLTDTSASRPTTWSLAGDVSGVTGLRVRLVGIVLR